MLNQAFNTACAPGGAINAAIKGGVNGGITAACAPGGAIDAAIKGGVNGGITASCAPGGAIDAAIKGGITAACAPGGAIDAAIKGGVTAACAPGGAMHVLSHNSWARSVNPLRSVGAGALIPLQTSAGAIPPGFPADAVALSELSGPQLTALLAEYGQPPVHLLQQRTAAFRSFIGLL